MTPEIMKAALARHAKECGDKVRFPKRGAARAAAAAVIAEAGLPMRPYPCVYCGGWHLTQAPPIGTDMVLPEGKSCSDCAAFSACAVALSVKGENTVCAWSPSRFKEPAARTPPDRGSAGGAPRSGG